MKKLALVLICLPYSLGFAKTWKKYDDTMHYRDFFDANDEDRKYDPTAKYFLVHSVTEMGGNVLRGVGYHRYAVSNDIYVSCVRLQYLGIQGETAIIKLFSSIETKKVNKSFINPINNKERENLLNYRINSDIICLSSEKEQQEDFYIPLNKKIKLFAVKDMIFTFKLDEFSRLIPVIEPQ